MNVNRKKLASLAIITTVLFSPISFAQDDSQTVAQLQLLNTSANTELTLLQQISNYTNNTVTVLNDKLTTLVTYFGDLPAYLSSWIAPDTSDGTKAIQPSLTALGEQLIKSQSPQDASIATLNQRIILPSDAQTQTNANDLVFSTVMGKPYKDFDADKNRRNPDGSKADPIFNYILNASAINMVPIPPSTAGSALARTRYRNMFNTMQAVKSFDAYVLSSQYAESSQYNQIQQSLITQATKQDWLSDIASTKVGLGSILRQLLMFESQMFVLMTQMLQYQKQLLTAQVMTNSLLIVNNQVNEAMLGSYSMGVDPRLK